jgi:mono/diheme cytochrome c family protein
MRSKVYLSIGTASILLALPLLLGCGPDQATEPQPVVVAEVDSEPEESTLGLEEPEVPGEDAAAADPSTEEPVATTEAPAPSAPGGEPARPATEKPAAPPPPAEPPATVEAEPEAPPAATPAATDRLDGRQVFLAQRCQSCHAVSSAGIDVTGAKPRADLAGVGDRHGSDILEAIIRQEQPVEGKKHSKRFTGTAEELQALVLWLSSQ